MRAFAFLAVILLTTSLAFAQTVFHPASEVAAGIFGSAVGGGNYTFNNSMFVVDKLGVGTTSPGYPLAVSGKGYFSDYLIASKLRSSAWGDVTAPAFTWEGDLSTGIYHPAAGKIALTMSGTEVMRLESGKVGIGTTNPSQKLTVNGSVNVSGTVYASNISSNSPLQLQTAGTTRLFINDTTGNIGVGSTSPNALLDVGASTPCYQETANVSTACGGLNTGTYAFSGTWTWPERVYDGDWETQSGSPVDGNFYVNYSKPSFAVTTSLWQVRTGGTPTTNFTIPSSCWSQNPLQFKIYINSSPGTEIGYCYNSTAWYQIFSSGYGNLYEDAMWWKKDVLRIGTDKLVIDPSGNVGIGTTSPSKTLTVVGNVNITGEIINYAAGHYYLGSAQSLPANIFTKINIDTAQWNDNSGFNTTDHRYIPQKAGYYICSGRIGFSVANNNVYVVFYRNGVNMQAMGYDSPNWAGTVGIVYLDGVDDYVELWGEGSAGGALFAIDGYTWFECAKI